MVESFAWMMWDSVILMSAWGIYGVILLRLIVGAFDSLRYRRGFFCVVFSPGGGVFVVGGGVSGSIQKIFISYIY